MHKKISFTMAEILLSLTIIGIVAAITLPALTGNINERTWNTQRKALYTRISQAVSLMPGLNGYGTLTPTDTAAETFVTQGLAKVLKINNICNNAHFQDCGFANSFKNIANTVITTPKTLNSLNNRFCVIGTVSGVANTPQCNTKAVAFETQNGESLVAYYIPTCRNQDIIEVTGAGKTIIRRTRNLCANFIYDLNGLKGPNTVGKDIGVITVFNSGDPNVVAPMPISAKNKDGNANWSTAKNVCSSKNADSRLPNADELVALLVNYGLFYNTSIIGEGHLTGSSASASAIWVVNDAGLNPVQESRTFSFRFRCVKR